MTDRATPRGGRARIARAVAAAALLLGPLAVSAQELPLKRELPATEADPCESVGLENHRSPTAEERAEAEQLLASARRSMILGETAAARAALRGALDLDPFSSAAYFELGRLLEEVGEPEGALGAFCRYVVLDPIGAERSEALAGIARLRAASSDPLPSVARTAYLDGVAAMDAGELDAAVREFSRALVEVPDWPEAHYNRGVAYFRQERRGAALADFERYLELAPGAPDVDRIRGTIRGARSPATGAAPSPTGALAVGLLMPGMGHFYAGRSGWGAVYLLGAAASVAAGTLYREVQVECRQVPGPDGCPPEQVESRTESQPLLVPGIGVAAGLTVLGAVHAFVRARGEAAGAGNALLEFPLDAGGGSALVFQTTGRMHAPAIRAGIRLHFP